MPETPSDTTSTAGDNGVWLTVREVATHLRLHPESVRRAIRSGDLPARRINGRGHYRIHVQHLETSAA